MDTCISLSYCHDYVLFCASFAVFVRYCDMHVLMDLCESINPVSLSVEHKCDLLCAFVPFWISIVLFQNIE